MTRVVNIRDLPHDPREWPPDHVYIGRRNQSRGLPESPYHNPFRISEGCSRSHSVMLFSVHVLPSVKNRALNELQDRVLVCWCHPLPCHGDVLADLCNLRSRKPLRLEPTSNDVGPVSLDTTGTLAERGET